MSDIKECFISRFGDTGKILSIDFSQLEIRYLAYLTQDKQLLEDVESGMDLHRMRAAELFDIPEPEVSDEQRTTAKALSFELQFGAGAFSMSLKHRLPRETCQKFIDNYYARYPQVKVWQDNLIAEVKSLRQSSQKCSPKGFPLGVAKWRSITGRIYAFTEYDSPEFMTKRGIMTGFNPAQIKNYPIQGGGSDLVALTRGKLMRDMIKFPWYMKQVLPIMTVHDSIEFDCDGEYVAPAIERIKYVVDKLPVFFKNRFGVELTVKFPVEIKTGPNWANMEKLQWE